MQRRIGHIIVLLDNSKRSSLDVSLVQVIARTIRQGLPLLDDDAAIQPKKQSSLNKLASAFAEKFTEGFAKRLGERSADVFWVIVTFVALLVWRLIA